jgi:ribonuclease J
MIKTKTQNYLRIIPLGGLGEVGRNMMLYEMGSEILVIDAGLSFPEEDMPGVDYVIPNVGYLQEQIRSGRKRIVGFLFTHGHYDHIGALPYLLPKLGFNFPMFASELTKGLILKRQEDFPDQPKLKIKSVKDGDLEKIGSQFTVEFFRLNHNVPGTLGFFISTKVGNIVHITDFKFDEQPINDLPTNFEKLKNLGKRGVLLLLMDSTGAEEEGHSLSEQQIFENLEKIFQTHKGRIFAATFASLLNRIQQIITLSEKYNRKVVIEGYSMRTNVEIARQLNYIRHKKGLIISAQESLKLPDSQVTVLCTGAQGEGGAALMRIANGEHRYLQLKKGDTVIFSSSVVPGNERSVQRLKDQLYRNKVNVIHYKMMDIHAGGHAQREELAQMIKLIKPKFFIPIHGQYSMLVNNAKIAQEQGLDEKNIAIVENGEIVRLEPNRLLVEKEKINANYVMVDGLGIGDVGEVVLRDRQALAKDGMFVIIAVVDRLTGKIKGSPDIISRGFVYLKESKELLRETRKRIIGIVNKSTGGPGAVNWVYVKDEIRNKIGNFLFQKTQRRPMVLPVIIEV